MSQRQLLTAFHSDNAVGASPSIGQALVEAGSGLQLPYGADSYNQQVVQQLQEVFETDLTVFLVGTGTAANALSLATITPPWGSVLCHPKSHINNDECGAPEFFTHGAKLIPVAGDDGKIDIHALTEQAKQKTGDIHMTQAASVSISQASETGSLYSLAEIQTIGEVCEAYRLSLHMDGARFANALVALQEQKVSPADMTWRAGVTALSFGGTKNGTLGVDAIVLFDKTLAQEMAFRRKRSGHLMSKMRLFSAQMQAYLQDDLWLDNARQANAMAQRMAAGMSKIDGVELISQQQSNILFFRLPEAMVAGLLAQGFGFYHDRWGLGVIRLVTSFAHQAEDIDHFVAAAAGMLA